MDDDTRSKDLTLPEDEPWMSHGFISKIAAQVSLPLQEAQGWRQGDRAAQRQHGRALPCFDPETNTLHLGTTFREFLRLIGVQVGGRQLKSIKPQLERLFKTTELFDVTAARDHFDGTVDAGECRFCRYDARNREHHARNAGTLF